jgi:urea carboxylase
VRRVLVANRGEIACRVIHTLDRLGIESVAVYSDADRDARHVTMATHSVAIGAAPPAASYLDSARILAAAADSGADAIHPGYGFLSENADFAAAVEARGFAFIGPTPEQIRSFGAKDRARELARSAQVPLLAGSAAFADPASAVALADAIGYPLLVKSIAGGGGIGMVRCDGPADLIACAERAIRQADQTFGDSRVFLERLIERARHVEVQVFGTGDGFVTVLGERDCSTQRRRQKVVEEAPACDLAPEVRQMLHDDARRLLSAVSYRSAGTVEFVVDADTSAAAFLEVNTRLQVEHGVTEAICGVDLVEWMVRLAAGDDSLPRAYTHRPEGHAIEVRVYAENPAKGFMPSTGLVTEVEWPPEARVDAWVTAGMEVSPYYDPLLAKIIVHESTRSRAVDSMQAALAATRISGVETNIDFVASFLATDTYTRGRVTTMALEQHTHSVATVDVLAGGSSTTVQDLPGRCGYWHVGVPPSGPMDDAAFRHGNRLLGNADGAPGLECTAGGPALRFHRATRVCLTGARVDATLTVEGAATGVAVAWDEPVAIPAGATLTLGSLLGAGLRSYVLVDGGFVVPAYLGSASTFTLAAFGGHGGRELRTGDVLHLRANATPRAPRPTTQPPDFSNKWELAVCDGPHGAPDFITADGIDALYTAEWTVHYNSSRTGVRLIGPRPDWARADGGEAGLHPSNIHDSPYTVGAVDFTGDMPIILGPDGPSLGGFVCPFTVTTGDRWKLGQLAPGDVVRFVRSTTLSAEATRAPRRTAAAGNPAVLGVEPARGNAPAATYRRAGDRALLVEYGPMVLDLDLRLRAHALGEWIAATRMPGVVDVTPGIRSLQVQVDGSDLTVESLLPRLRAAEAELPPVDDVTVPSRTVHLPLSWDDPATQEAIDRYMRTVRDDAPWCPWNIEFIRRINGLEHVEDVRTIVYDAEYLVLGLGDVYLGAPVAVPVDPRHRLVTTKYNPARTWTPENAVGIGGAYLCIYGMEGPGGYQFVGRTVPVWHRFGAPPHTTRAAPWLLRFFDRIHWYPVDADQLLEMRAAARAGRLELQIDDGMLSSAEHHRFVAAHRDEIARFHDHRNRAFAIERDAWERAGEFERVDAQSVFSDPVTSTPLGELPDGAYVIESSMQACVWRVHVGEGQVVAPGEVIVTVEAMKMETPIASPTGGTVHRIVCEEGRMVMPGAPLVVLVTDA